MYDFSKMTNRFNTNSYKWDVKENELPMWVADMDFETAPAIIDALHNRIDHKIFGYNTVPDDYFEAYQNWWERRHHFHMEKDWMMFVTGVVPAISSVVRKVTTVGENVLIMSPVYNIFYNSILNNGRHVLSSDLVFDGKEYLVNSPSGVRGFTSKLAFRCNFNTSFLGICPLNTILSSFFA